jgi:hypothetical protein
MEEQLLMETLDPYTCRTFVGSISELALSLCVKDFERWILEGLCNSKRMPEPRRVGETRKRKIKNDIVG